MDTTTMVSAMAGVLGSLVGASTTIAADRLTQEASKRELLRAERNKREMLYGEFIGECS